MARDIVDRIGEHACFPYSYVSGFNQFLNRHADVIEVFTYADMEWGEDEDFRTFYPNEHWDWKDSLANGRRNPDKIYVLIQHDVDNVPQRTHRLMTDEAAIGIAANVMCFHERHRRQTLAEKGTIEPAEYTVDWGLCRRLQEECAFVFGYHANAFERALFEPQLAMEIFRRDVEQLRKRLDIRFFSPHGGVRNDNGETNADWVPPAECLRNLRWVHNRYGCRFDANWSDGGPNGKRDPRERDLRDFVKTWKPGKRYRVLVHPQYYDEDFKLSRRLLEAPWYQEITRCADESAEYDPWQDFPAAPRAA